MDCHETVFFNGPDSALSNFGADTLTIDGKDYPCMENGYQAQKSEDYDMPPEQVERIASIENSFDVKEQGNELPKYKDGRCQKWTECSR